MRKILCFFGFHRFILKATYDIQITAGHAISLFQTVSLAGLEGEETISECSCCGMEKQTIYIPSV